MKWVSSLLSQFSRPISIRYLHSQSRARIYTARVACYSKIFFRLANFTRQFWRVEIRFLSEQWTTEITHPGDDPHFLPNWISNESLWRHEQIAWELFAIRRIKLYSKWFHFLFIFRIFPNSTLFWTILLVFRRVLFHTKHF